MDSFDGLWFECQEHITETSKEQCVCERDCSGYLKSFCQYTKETRQKLFKDALLNDNEDICLIRNAHASYLLTGLLSLPGGFVSLDASRPWIAYWILHALHLLSCDPVNLYPRIISTLKTMQQIDGGFGGGPLQMAHCAPTYASVLALCTIGSLESLSIINRGGLYKFFLSMKDRCGGFRMHRDGEVDCRGTYTVIAIARICNILTPELTDGVLEYLLQCQHYEGGFGGEPCNEAHGGYNFCAIASLLILNKASDCDLDALEYWLVNRQMKLEGGFQGRTNKLVDACYSFWQGSALAVVEIIRQGGSDLYDMELYLSSTHQSDSTLDQSIEFSENLSDSNVSFAADDNGSLLFNQKALQRYILHCSQNIDGGGLRDKPGKHRDYYHTCYALSGLSISQNSHLYRGQADTRNHRPLVYGDLTQNLVVPTSAVFNVGLDKLRFAIDYFGNLPTGHQYLMIEAI